MNGLDDLRRTLDDHADAVVDHDLAVRGGAVHRRVARARLRRRGAVGVGAAAVLAVAAGVGLSGGQHGGSTPAARVVGVVAPAQLHSLGFTYAFDGSVEGHDGRAVLRLTASPEPRLVSWATSGGDQSVTVDGPVLDAPVAYDTGDFGDFTYVPAGDPATVSAEVRDGEPGLAVYTLTGDRPPGVTKDGVTFRQDLAGGRLLGATIGDVGQGEVDVPATATGPGVGVKYFCSGGPADAYLHIDHLEHGRGGVIEGGHDCGAPAPVDAASAAGSGFPTSVGEDTGLRLYVTAGEKGPAVSDPGLRLGLGIYALDQSPVGAHGFTPRLLEYSGHQWTRASVVRSGSARVAGSSRRALHTVSPSGRGVVLAVLFSTGRAGADETLGATFEGTTGIGFQGGGAATQRVIAAGTGATIRLEHGHLRGAARFGIAFYVEAD